MIFIIILSTGLFIWTALFFYLVYLVHKYVYWSINRPYAVTPTPHKEVPRPEIPVQKNDVSEPNIDEINARLDMKYHKDDGDVTSCVGDIGEEEDLVDDTQASVDKLRRR